MNGFILLSREILEKSVFASEKLLKIWIWILLKANYKNKTVPLKIGKGQIIVDVKRGSFIFGRHKAEEELFIDGSTIYKCIQKLKDLECIEIDSNNQYSIITVCNYDHYQNPENYEEQVSNNQVTSEEQVSNNQVTQHKKDNTDKKDKKVKKDKKEIHIEAPDIFQVQNYFAENGYNKESAIRFFNYYSVANWKDSKGNQVKSWKQKAQAVWFREENKIKPTYVQSPLVR